MRSKPYTRLKKEMRDIGLPKFKKMTNREKRDLALKCFCLGVGISGIIVYLYVRLTS